MEQIIGARKHEKANPNIEKIFQYWQRQLPKPTTELNYKNGFELLIAVILSAQATDVSVNKATEKLFTIADTPEKIIKLGVNPLKSYIKTIGLFNSKANNVIKTCELLVSKYAGKIPNTREQLEQLPGVGRKTANVILNTFYNLPTVAVDTHIFRLANRLNIGTGKNVLEVEKKLLENIPPKFLYNAHHWMILHGRYVCKARNPLCGECGIAKYCPIGINKK